MSDKVTLRIDGQQITVDSSLKIVDAAKSAGIDISVFCYHPKLEPVGACRLCLVEIGRPQRDRSTGEPLLEDDGTPQIYFSGNLETSCTVPVAEGLVVYTRNEKVLQARENILEFLLTSHPLDCPVCDKGGECSLQELTFSYGIPDSRFPLEQKIQLGKQLPLGDLILLDQERCIQCGRCIRFQREIAGDPVLAFYNRGRKTEIISRSDPVFDSYWSGNTTDICPVGALTTKDFRFEARVWEMDPVPSICSHCPVGCNITINTRLDPKSGKKKIQRVMPRQNEWVNELWICDKGRFAHQFTSSPERLTRPLARNEQGELKPISWKKALEIASRRLEANPGGLLTLVGHRLSNEDYYQLGAFTRGVGGKPVLNTSQAGGDLAARLSPAPGSNLLDAGPGTTILVAASDLEEEAPVWYLRLKAASERGASLIVMNPRKTKLDRYADQVIRYSYGQETKTLLSLDKKHPDAARMIAEAENLMIFYGSEGMDHQASLVFSQACANILIEQERISLPNSGLIPVWPGPNSQGAWEMGFTPSENLAEDLDQASVLLIAGADPAAGGVMPDLEGKFVIVQDLFLTETAKAASLVLPAAAPTEKSGTFTSGDRRLQIFSAALDPIGDCRTDSEIAVSLAKQLGIDLVEGGPLEILAEIIKNVPGYETVSLAGLRLTPKQWPFVAREALSFTGTVFKNTTGIGTILPGVGDTPVIQKQQLSQPKPGFSKGTLAVPVRRLYDQGVMIRTSEVLVPRLVDYQFVIHPAEASKLGIGEGDLAEMRFDSRTFQGRVHLDDGGPESVVLVPRNLGIPLVKVVNASITGQKKPAAEV